MVSQGRDRAGRRGRPGRNGGVRRAHNVRPCGAFCGRLPAKRRSRPLSRDESACLRGATHVRSDAAPSGPSGAGRGPRPSPGPLVGPSPVRLAVGAFSRGRPLCSGGVDGTCPVRAVMPHDSIPKRGKSQWGSDGDARGLAHIGPLAGGRCGGRLIAAPTKGFGISP